MRSISASCVRKLGQSLGAVGRTCLVEFFGFALQRVEDCAFIFLLVGFGFWFGVFCFGRHVVGGGRHEHVAPSSVDMKLKLKSGVG